MGEPARTSEAMGQIRKKEGREVTVENAPLQVQYRIRRERNSAKIEIRGPDLEKRDGGRERAGIGFDGNKQSVNLH